jgi:hypothetical protein
MSSVLQKNNFVSKPGFWLFLSAFFLYMLASPGNLPGDTELRWSVSRQMVRGLGFSLEDSISTQNYAVGIGGKRYALYGLGQSLCLLPFAELGLVLEKTMLVGADVADLVAQFLASVIIFPAAGAVCVWVFYHLVLALDYNKRVAIGTAAVLGGCTMYLHYSVNTQEQSQIALLLVLAVLFMTRYYQRRRSVYIWLFCVTLGMCILFRPSSVPEVLVICLAMVVGELSVRTKVSLSRRLSRWLAAGILGFGSFVVVAAWYNYIRFGSVFETGYALSTPTSLGGHSLFESSPLPTLAAMLFSPGKSIFLYNPVLLLSVSCVWGFYRRHRIVALAVLLAIVVNFVFHSFFTAWAGDYAWSVRYQVPVLPFLVLPMAHLFNSNLKAFTRKLVVLLIMISALIQLASVVYNFNLEYVQNPNHCVIPDEWVWDWRQSHLFMRFESIGRHILNNRDFSSVKVTQEEPLLLKINQTEQSVRRAYYVNFFPFKAAAMMRSDKMFYTLLIMWILCVGAFCISTLKLARAYLAENPAIRH